MLNIVFALFAALFLMVASSPARAAASPGVAADTTVQSGPAIGAPAPDFTATDSNGKTVTLAGLKGKTVVLEWTNNQCPFVRKFYDTNTMQTLQKDATGKGVVWLTIVSSAEGKQGYTNAEEANQVIADEKSSETARLLDASGAIGRAYGASTTPHMFVIDPAGNLVYAGGIDDQPSVSHASVKEANNYVKAALDDLAAGRPVQIATSKPYGCGVKY